MGHTKSSRRERRRCRTAWPPRGRRLVVVDIENVVGGPCTTAAMARWARSTVHAVVGIRPEDQVVVACDGCGVASVGWEWPHDRLRFGHGEDGADRELLAVLAEDVPRRFPEVVLVSGDGIFTGVVTDLTREGVAVTVVAHAARLSRRLRLAAIGVRLLSPGEPSPHLPGAKSA